MEKEIEYINDEIKTLEYHIANPIEYNITPTIKVKINDSACYEDKLKILNNIKQALLELKSIKEANPSEALECSLKLYKMVESAGNGNGFNLNEAWKYHKNIKQALTTKSKKEQAFDFLTKNFKVMVGVDKGKDLDFACLMFSAKDLKKVFWLAGVYKQQDLKTYNQLLELKEVLNDNSQE
jgi:hypothetical protein